MNLFFLMCNRQRLEMELVQAQVKVLGGLLPICAHCKKTRDDQGYWRQIESYLPQHSQAEFTHGIYPQCMRELYPEHLRETEASGGLGKEEQ